MLDLEVARQKERIHKAGKSYERQVQRVFTTGDFGAGRTLNNSLVWVFAGCENGNVCGMGKRFCCLQ